MQETLILVALILSVFVTIHFMFLTHFATEFSVEIGPNGATNATSNKVNYFNSYQLASISWLVISALVWSVAILGMITYRLGRFEVSGRLSWLSASGAVIVAISFVGVTNGWLFVPAMLFLLAGLFRFFAAESGVPSRLNGPE
jgi:hypothetical protein